MFTTKPRSIYTFCILLFIGVTFPVNAYAIGADFMPMVSLSWDKMLGLNVGLGASTGADMFIGMTGPYVYTNLSLQKKGLSLSTGHYVTFAGITSMRNGITYLESRDTEYAGAYFGASHSMTLVAGYYNISGLKKLEDTSFHFNSSLGVGIF